MKIRKGDTVTIMKGKEKGKTGKVLKVDVRKSRTTVEGLNLYKKHVRARKAGQKGESVSVPRPIAVSNLSVVCRACGRAARVGYRREGENKARICKRCNTLI